MKKYFLIWAVAWIIIYTIVAKTGYPDAANGIIGAAAITLYFLYKKLGSSWKGEVIEIKTEQKTYSDDGDISIHDIDYAYIKLTNGKTKKIQDLGWKVGDKLEKKSGQVKPQVI